MIKRIKAVFWALILAYPSFIRNYRNYLVACSFNNVYLHKNSRLLKLARLKRRGK